VSRVGASFAQNSSGVIFPRGQLRANSNATPIIGRARPVRQCRRCSSPGTLV